jgi:hypothetical protein
VDRQQDGPKQVAWLVRAWTHAMDMYSPISAPAISDILLWGYLACPDMNRTDRWRDVQVYVGDSIPPPPQELWDRMERWHDALPRMTPEEAYTEFERIHPFRDGNGRVGKIVLFWLRGELDRPDIDKVPNPWSISNP